MSKVYVYESCIPIVQISNKKTQVIQTEKLSFTNVPSTIFKDENNLCWVYIGEFESSYLPPQDVFVVKYGGNFFKSDIPVLFPTCDSCQVVTITACTEVFYNATRCDDNTSVVVKVCNVGPTSSSIKLLPTVGQICGIINPNGDDFCVTLTSTTEQTSTEYSIITPAWETYTCDTCPLYKSYTINSCDGIITGITVYNFVKSDTLSIGTVVNITSNNVCYVVTSYNGIVSDYKFGSGQIPQITQSFSTCNECLINYYNTKK